MGKTQKFDKLGDNKLKTYPEDFSKIAASDSHKHNWG